MSVWEDFKLKYAPPKVEGLTVGFSGIDPAGYAATLTEEQLEMVKALVLAYISTLTIRIDSGSIEPDAPPPEVQPITLHPTEIPHELLDGLMGGDEDGHYHLTDVELEKLKAMIQTFVPDGEEVDPHEGISSHEMLNGLFGGNANGHYHFTSDEWTKLRKVLDKLFPDGATEPQFPSVPAEPSTPDEPEVDTGGLPKGTPPAWTQVAFPSGYTAWSGYQKMYYGGVPYTKTTTRNELLAVMQNGRKRQIMRTTNLSTWNYMMNLATGLGTGANYVGDAVYDYLELAGNSRQQLYIMHEVTKGYNITVGYTTSSSGDLVLTSTTIASQSKSGNTDSFVAAAYSPSLNMAIFVNNYGCVTCVKDNKALTTNYKNLYLPFSYVQCRTAAWNPDTQTFCALGYSMGGGGAGVGNTGIHQHVAVSSNGQIWSSKEIGVILIDLSYRSDLGCLFARCVNNGHFYVSGDGLNWQQYSATSLPVGDAKFGTDYVPNVAFSYNPTLGWYCAVGGKSNVAYFSKDLKHWISTTVTNGATIEMGDVIWAGGSINKFVIMPKSGNYFYTFDPTSWKDGD